MCKWMSQSIPQPVSMPLAQTIEAAWRLRFREEQRRISDSRSAPSMRATLQHRDISLGLTTLRVRELESREPCGCKIPALSLPLNSRAIMFLGSSAQAAAVLPSLEALPPTELLPL